MEVINTNSLKGLREKQKMRQEDLAQEMHVDRSSVAKWETGESMPRAEKLPLLAKVLKCSIDELLSKDKSAV